MIGILSKIFIKNHRDYGNAEVRSAYGTLCSVVAIVLNICLSAAKFVVGSLSGSISITADAVNNLTDAGSSVITFFGFRFSGKKPDYDHPFGHGRIEYITGLIVSGVILIAGYETLKDSAVSAIAQVKYYISPEKFAAPDKIEFSYVAVAVLVLSILVKFYMAFFMKGIGKKIDSTVMKATGADAMGDTVSTFLTLVCMLFFKFTSVNLDAFAGVFVSFVILKAGIDSAKETLLKLLGTKPDPELVQKIRDTVMEYPEVIGIHDMIIHDYGPGRFMVSLHAEVDGNGDIYKLHDATDRIAMTLADRFACEAVVHMDPVDVNDENFKLYKATVERVVSEIAPELSVHDVRIVPGFTHTNIIFDVLVPFKYKMPDDELKAKISRAVKKEHPKCYCAIMIDRSYV